MSNRGLSERLNKELDAIGVPDLMSDRIQAFAKMLKLPRFKAEAVLNGMMVDAGTMQTIASELEVSVDWLLGKKKNKNTH
ncbi:hypothetical protein Lbir_2333 [Legionella birminghamensis]|uniref:Uncharacterized protein n=1 Tax=Legionella birminghamensis TaxID=28083 RepID=A0A378IDE1_9GAMM|nr:hypothetical protein [Legionella birminghamensis]KTC68800.1 hypothetical protein Lbir_2333 [Legionella birminghamensis]STX33258.1 Uncharacterised protein [Legionella birminghamensis]